MDNQGVAPLLALVVKCAPFFVSRLVLQRAECIMIDFQKNKTSNKCKNAPRLYVLCGCTQLLYAAAAYICICIVVSCHII